MKKHLRLWDGAGKPASSCSSPLNDWVSEDSVCHLSAGDRGDLSHVYHQALTQDSREREVSSDVLQNMTIEDKLKRRRMSEGLISSQKGLTDSSVPPGIFLKPVRCRAGSQRLQRAFRPVPPIQHGLPSSEPSMITNGELERGDNGTGCVGGDGNNNDWMSEEKPCQAFLPPLYCTNGDGKATLGAALIPPIPKSVRPPDEDSGRAAVPLPSSQHLLFREALEMRPRSGSRSEEKTLKALELQPLEPVLPPLQRVGGMKSAGHLCDHVPPLTGLPLSQAKQTDHRVNPHLLSDDGLKDSSGRIHVTLSKSAQKKTHQKRRREMELSLREEKRDRGNSLQLPTLSVDPGDAAEGTNSLPAIALDTPAGGEEPESGDAQEARPFPYPQQALLNALAGLSSDDWERKAEGLLSIRRLAICHSEVLLRRLHDVSVAVTKEVNNLRSKVARSAMSTLGELFRNMKNHMDHQVDEVARVLLQKMGDSNEFIQKAADQSLEIMVGSVTPTRATTALMASGVPHRNVLVRRCAAKHLLMAMERVGAEKLLSGVPYSTDLLVRTVVKLAQDCHQDTRCYGREMLNMLMKHKKFKKYLKQSAPSRDLLDVMATIQQKETEEHKGEPTSAKDRRKSKNSGLTKAQDNLPHDGGKRQQTDKTKKKMERIAVKKE